MQCYTASDRWGIEPLVSAYPHRPTDMDPGKPELIGLSTSEVVSIKILDGNVIVKFLYTTYILPFEINEIINSLSWAVPYIYINKAYNLH